MSELLETVIKCGHLKLSFFSAFVRDSSDSQQDEKTPILVIKGMCNFGASTPGPLVKSMVSLYIHLTG